MLRGMGADGMTSTSDPYVTPDEGVGDRTVAAVVCGAAAVVNLAILLLSLVVPAFGLSRLLAAVALGITAGEAAWPSRRTTWSHGPDTRWLLRVAAWNVVLALAGLLLALLRAAS